MRREITTHKVNGCNAEIVVQADGEPGPGGACQKYVAFVPYDAFNEELNAAWTVWLNFQNGPVAEVGTNGITHEVLLAILIDRLEGFQRGPFACEENRVALNCLRMATESLQSRTLERVARGVEGTRTV